MLSTIIFYISAGIAVLSAALMVTRRNARHALFFLFMVLLAAAGIFLQLHSRLLFAMQIVFFAGLTMAMFFFAMRSADTDAALRELRFSRQKWMVLLIAVAAGGEAGLIYWSIRKRPLIRLLALAGLPAGKPEPNVLLVLQTLFRTYSLSFEIALVLALVAAVG